PRPVRDVDGASTARRPRTLDSHRRARHREREPPDSTEPRAGVARDGRLAPDRLPPRDRLRGPPKHGDRPCGHVVRALRHLHAELPPGPAADLSLRGYASMSAVLRLH